MTTESDFKWSIAACTSVSAASITGSRLVFWLHPAVSALRVSGYVSGTVCCFSSSTPMTRVSRSESAGRLAIPASVSELHVPQQAEDADGDEVDGGDEGREPRHDEDEDAGGEGDERREVGDVGDLR